jgi:hypothetical protein
MRLGKRERALAKERIRWRKRCRNKAAAVVDDKPGIRLSCYKRNPVNASPKKCNGQGWKWDHNKAQSVRVLNRM